MDPWILLGVQIALTVVTICGCFLAVGGVSWAIKQGVKTPDVTAAMERYAGELRRDYEARCQALESSWQDWHEKHSRVARRIEREETIRRKREETPPSTEDGLEVDTRDWRRGHTGPANPSVVTPQVAQMTPNEQRHLIARQMREEAS